MGVRGLTTYINFNEDTLLKTFLLHDTCLVIDGHSLCAQLYRRLNCFSAFGGDYDKYAVCVKNFFKNIRKCNITPYVLFDGSYETRKLKTAYKRLKSKILSASQLDPVTQGSIKMFPLLLREVFIEAIKDLDVKYTICEFEADDEIAVLARRLNCPVLSYDSDFFIYNVLYIPFNTLDSKPKPIDYDNKRIYALECKIYKVEYLTSQFGGLNEDMLPLLATLLGNDFIEKRVFRNFLSQLKLHKGKRPKNEQQRCIQTLLKWLQNETLDTAVTKILGRLKKAKKDKVLAMIQKSIEGYTNTYCNSLKYFDITENPKLNSELNTIDLKNIDLESRNDDDDSSGNESENDDESSDDNSDDQNKFLPSWFVEGVRYSNIPKQYLNLYTHHLYICTPQAEDYTAEDSFLHTLPILRYAFDLITNFSVEHCIYVSRENCNSYRRIFVDKQYSISRPFEVAFSDLTQEQLHLCFHHFIKETLPLLDLTMVELLPSNFQIFMISILWWVSKCEITLAQVHTLIICYIMLEVIDEKTGTFRGHHFFNNKYSKKIDEIRKNPQSSIQLKDEELMLNKNKVQYEDCLLAASVLLQHFELDEKIKKRPKTYDVKLMHAFAQFQCCLMQFNSLNTLCRLPYQSTKYYKSYNGTFVYNVSVKLENELDVVSFMDKYIKGATTVLLMYKSICQIYSRCSEKMELVMKKWEGRKRRKRNGKKRWASNDDMSFIVNGFETEVVI